MASTDESDIVQPSKEGFNQDDGCKDDFAEARRRPNRRCSVTEHILRAQQECLNQMKEQNSHRGLNAFGFESHHLLSCLENSVDSDEEECSDVLTNTSNEQNPANDQPYALQPVASSKDSNGSKDLKAGGNNPENEFGKTEGLPSSKRALLRLWPRRVAKPEQITKGVFK